MAGVCGVPRSCKGHVRLEEPYFLGCMDSFLPPEWGGGQLLRARMLGPLRADQGVYQFLNLPPCWGNLLEVGLPSPGPGVVGLAETPPGRHSGEAVLTSRLRAGRHVLLHT